MNEIVLSADAKAQAFRHNVEALQQRLLEEPDQWVPEVQHHFADGVYARTCTMPKGFFGIGRIHRVSHMCVLSKGVVQVCTEDGIELLKAPLTFVAKPGTKRVFFVIEEAVWTTVHHTTSTDIQTIERELVADTYDQLLQLE